jgi:AhpD family alkylhydroperoxidase
MGGRTGRLPIDRKANPMAMSARLPYHQLAPRAFEALLGLSNTIHHGALGARLVDLVFLRVSQLNGCAYCIDMHWRDLIRHDADPRHLNTVAGWRESPFFSDRERAALEWAEAISSRSHHATGDEEFAGLRRHFTDAEVAELGFAISAITAWNLLNLGFRNPVPEKP